MIVAPMRFARVDARLATAIANTDGTNMPHARIGLVLWGRVDKRRGTTSMLKNALGTWSNVRHVLGTWAGRIITGSQDAGKGRTP